MSRIAIKVSNISKRYRIGVQEEKPDTFFGVLSSWVKYPLTNLRRVQRLSEFEENSDSDDIIWALKDINFEVKQGEVLGIVGKNGAGKSTLLKILARITEPTSGRAEISGRIASLLEVGTGFHPELTGRENVYLNGTILGMSKLEIDSKFDEIVGFSGIKKFIDTPVKRYSSGMRVRLAFSVAAFLEPEILLIDEVLAVGDVEFQKKCIGKMGSIAGEGRTVLFVSHNMAAVSDLTERCVYLEDGKLFKEGKTSSIVPLYIKNSMTGDSDLSEGRIQASSENSASFCELDIFNKEGKQTNLIDEFEPVVIRVGIRVNSEIDSLQVGCGIVRLDMNTELFTVPSEEYGPRFQPGLYKLQMKIEPNYLRYGIYGLTLKLIANGLRKETIRLQNGFTIIKKSTGQDGALYQRWINGPLLFDYKWQLLKSAEDKDTSDV